MRSPTLAAGFILAMASAAHAYTGNQPAAHGHAAASACDTAHQSAWFERQRRLTDGDADPLASSAAARECTETAPMHGEAMSDGGTEAAAQRAPRSMTAGSESPPRVY